RWPRRLETASKHPLRAAMLPGSELNEARVLRGTEHLTLSALSCRFGLGPDRAGEGTCISRRIAADLLGLKFYARLGRLEEPGAKLDRSSYQPALQPLAADDRHLHGDWHQFSTSTIVMRGGEQGIQWSRLE